MKPNIARWQQQGLTLLLITIWLWSNRASWQWFFASFRSTSALHLVLVLGVAGFVVVQLGKIRSQLQISVVPSFRTAPLCLLLVTTLGAIALPFFADIPQIKLLLFLLASYGLLGLFVSPSQWRKGLIMASLIALIVPFSTQFNSGLGFPVRVITAQAVERILTGWQISAISSHDIILLENGIAQVDLPCSGLKSLWTGTMFLLAASWLERRKLGVRWLLVCAANFVFLITANITRVLLLVLILAVWQQPALADIVHVPLGILAFICACGASWLLLQTVPKFRSSEVQEFRSSEVQEFRSSGVQEFRSSEGGYAAAIAGQKSGVRSQKSEEGEINYHPLPLTPYPLPLSEKIEGRRQELYDWRSRWLVGLVVIILALGLQVKPPGDISIAISSINLPGQISTENLPLTAAEKRFFDNPAHPLTQKQRFTFGNLSGSMLFVASSTWQTHHPPELCLTGNGLRVDTMEPKLLTQSVQARWLSLQAGKLSAAYWFQSPQSTTDNFLSRIWDYVIHRNQTWVLVSVLFDSHYEYDNAEVQAFASTIYDAVKQSLTSASVNHHSA